jgi:hypothetical protein
MHIHHPAFLAFGGVLFLWWLFMTLYTYFKGRIHPLWDELSLWQKFDVCSSSAIGVPWMYFKEYLQRRQIHRLLKVNCQVWDHATENPIETDTLEGFRSILGSPSMSQAKAVKLAKGEYKVNVPVQVLCDMAVLDLSEATFVYSGKPVLEFQGSANAIMGLKIKDVPAFTDSFQMTGSGDNCLFSAIGEVGNLFMNLCVEHLDGSITEEEN